AVTASARPAVACSGVTTTGPPESLFVSGGCVPGEALSSGVWLSSRCCCSTDARGGGGGGGAVCCCSGSGSSRSPCCCREALLRAPSPVSPPLPSPPPPPPGIHSPTKPPGDRGSATPTKSTACLAYGSSAPQSARGPSRPLIPPDCRARVT
ncbi:hypothetical protein Vafri_6319, partial [Volvox africanus]